MVRDPPINIVLTLEAVTRLGSFKRAAEELLVTPSAVSHRVRTLEGLLGCQLFDRVGQGIVPTSQALRLADVVGKARRDISHAWQEIQAEATATAVHVSCTPAFAANYILPNMDSFRRLFPRFELELVTSLPNKPPRELRYDILISYGATPGPEWQAEEIIPLNAQAIVASGATHSMLANGKLIGPLITYRNGPLDWASVANRLGLELGPDVVRITVDSVEAACAAAERGVGVALAPLATARRLIDSGRVKSVGNPIDTGLRYWLAIKRSQRDTPVIESFRRWILNRVAKDLDARHH